MRRAAVLVLLALVGCGQDDERSPAATKATATPTATAAPPPRTVDVRFRAADGRAVTAQYAPAGKDAPAVVLLHEIRGGPDQWDDLTGDLHAAGFATLAYLSRPSVMERERVADTLGAIRWLRGRPDVDRRRLALVGASIGASTTVYAMAGGARRAVDAAVALSPADSSDIWDLQDHDRYRPHDMLLVSDDREAESAESMLEGAVRSRAIRSERPGHGVALLAEPGVREALLDWLGQRVR
jgi:cephalosporin-C deacetylase-like acetyl esterase